MVSKLPLIQALYVQKLSVASATATKFDYVLLRSRTSYLYIRQYITVLVLRELPKATRKFL